MLRWDKNDDISLMINVLKHDGVLLASSDTVLGLFAQLSEKSKKKLDAIKRRNLKPYIVIVQSRHQISRFIDQELDVEIQNIMDRYWPGPLTMIFKAKSTLPYWMVGVDGTIAIRVPEHEGLQKILSHVHGLFTTSANISDQPLPMTYDQVNYEIVDQVDASCCDPLAVYDGPASTIIDVSMGTIKIIRMGAIKIDSI